MQKKKSFLRLNRIDRELDRIFASMILEKIPKDDTSVSGMILRHLIPMFPGSWLAFSSDSAKKRYKAVASESPNEIAFRDNQLNGRTLSLCRTQPFENKERQVVRVFQAEMKYLQKLPPNKYWSAIESAAINHVVAKSTSLKFADSIFSVIDIFEKWSQETYEGKKISCAIGFEVSNGAQGENLQSILAENFSKVISNGLDSLIVFDQEGKLVDQKAQSQFQIAVQSRFAPLRYEALSGWSSGGKVCVVLNRNGEILVFSEGSIKFVKRRGRWHHFTHSSLIQQMPKGGGKIWSKALRTEIYKSCLDVSFSRGGGCLALVRTKTAALLVKKLIGKQDYLEKPVSIKAKALTKVINGRPFDKLSREERVGLLGIDGATILAPNGRIIAAGAIIKIPRGSSSGGRLAAATRLAKLGLALKISSDGTIIGLSGRQGNTYELFVLA